MVVLFVVCNNSLLFTVFVVRTYDYTLAGRFKIITITIATSLYLDC